MKTIIALIWNTRDTYDRYWVRNYAEDRDAFIKRMRKNYPAPKWYIDFYEGESID